MTTIDATVSVMESMPEGIQIMVYNYAQTLLKGKNFENPFVPLTEEMILADLEESRRQIEEGKVSPVENVIRDMEIKYGFA